MKATRNTVTDALKARYERLKVCFYAYGNKITIYANSDYVLPCYYTIATLLKP